MGDLLIERDRARGCILLPVGAKRRGPQQLHGAPPDSDPKVWRSSLTESAGTRRPRKLASEVVFCFPALRFDAFSPYRDSRYCCAPKPGKEKHKSYDYRSAILMVHRFRSFLSVFTPVLRKIWRKVTQKNQKTDEPRITRMSRIGERSARRLGFRLASDTDALQLSSDLQQRCRALPDLSE
jgi:hypothetical protein